MTTEIMIIFVVILALMAVFTWALLTIEKRTSDNHRMLLQINEEQWEVTQKYRQVVFTVLQEIAECQQEEAEKRKGESKTKTFWY